MKVASWNVCLGLTHKKEIVEKLLKENLIDICCIQEADISPFCNPTTLSFNSYDIEVEQNDLKRRVCIYVKNGVKI